MRLRSGPKAFGGVRERKWSLRRDGATSDSVNDASVRGPLKESSRREGNEMGITFIRGQLPVEGYSTFRIRRWRGDTVFKI